MIHHVPQIIDCLEKTPVLLRNLVAQIPIEIRKIRRIPAKWSIHEHACHVASGDGYGFIRWKQFSEEERPVIVPMSGESYSPDHFINMDIEIALNQFDRERAEVVRLARAADREFWTREADHPEYELYTPHIMLRHRLMHDHFHMYRIEELWLTRAEWLPGCAVARK